MKQLDFIIIGAQKSATTSMFKYLSEHPGIIMPADKEAPFFSNTELFNQGWSSFIENYFPKAPIDKLWGTASPQYMGDHRAAQRIAEQNPGAKLIAILRNPIERSYSHYTMSKRRELDNRDFDQVVNELLNEEHLQQYRQTPPPEHNFGYESGEGYESNEDTHFYCVWSEYGRILKQYRKYFAKEQLLVLYMDELISDPKSSINKVTAFLGLQEEYTPANLGKVYHKGGSRLFIPNAWKEAIKDNGLFRFFWDRVPSRTRGYLNYWYEQMNVRKNDKKSGPSEQAKEKMTQHFIADIKLLESITGSEVPWSAFHNK
jgi:hypothetical protein